MKLKEFRSKLGELNKVEFVLENGTKVPEHFHITEIGLMTKEYVDCGGEWRRDEWINFQLWYSTDLNHQLRAEKIISILELVEKRLNLDNQEIEIEYQGDSIGRYDLDFEDNCFVLKFKHTNCLALDKCGIIESEVTHNQENVRSTSCCTPSGKCC